MQREALWRGYSWEHCQEQGAELWLSPPQSQLLMESLGRYCAGFTPDSLPILLASGAETALRQSLHDNPALLRLLEVFIDDGDVPFIVLRNLLNCDDLPPTPSDDSVPQDLRWHLPAAALLGLLQLGGLRAAAYLDEMGGRLLHMVMPARNHPDSYRRSTKPLNMHTEVSNGVFAELQSCRPNQPRSPDAFGLVCLRNPTQAATTVLLVDDVIAQLPGDSLQILRQAHFRASSQSSFDREIILDDIPVIARMPNGKWSMRYSHNKLHGNTPEAEAALQCLRQIVSQHDGVRRVALSPGDVLLINNRRCLHGRDGLADAANFDGQDRWLLRAYGFGQRAWVHARKQPNHPHILTLSHE